MAPHHRLAVPGAAGAALGAAALAAIFFATAGLSMSNFGVNTPIWFSNAIAVAWLLQHETRRWPLLASAIWCADSLAIERFGSDPAMLLAIADTAEVLATAFLIRRIGGAASALSNAWGMVRLILICLGVPIFSALWGAAMLAEAEGEPFVPAMQQWYGATSLGLLIALPTLLIWLVPELRPRLSRAQLWRTLALAAGFALLTAYVFDLDGAASMFLVFPALLLLVWNSGLAGASIGAMVLVAVGLVQTLSGGSVVQVLIYPVTGVVPEIQALQIYIAALALSSLPLAVVLTDQRRLAVELARVAESRSEFLAAMSHEIRTPMTGVLGMVDLLDAEALTARQKNYLESIRASGRHLLTIINDILDFSRIETGRIDLEHIDFSLPLLLERLRSLLNPIAVERGIALKFDLPVEPPPVVRGDPTRLKQVLVNLIGNAIKFTEEGRVDVNLSCSAPVDGEYRFRFEVRDTGIGIPTEKQADLFAAFTQADNSTRRRFGGSGLGLAISKRLVTAMGGDIGVDSRQGEGSLFWFELPLQQGDAARLPQPRGEAPAPVAPRRILLAEDVELNRDIVRTMLERDGHSVTIANNGEEAVAYARDTAFDIVLMDVHMPVRDGLEATRAIRALPPPAGNVPILALTANVMVTEQAKCLDAGMDGVLMKPVEWDRVRAAIEQFCAEAKAAPEAGVADDERAPPFDNRVLDRLGKILPTVLLQSHLAAVSAEVRRLAETAMDPAGPELAASAHKIVSQAGMLGLMRLSELAARIEQAAFAGSPVAPELARFRAAAADVRLASAWLSERVAEPARRTS